jgi:hypothetical protein
VLPLLGKLKTKRGLIAWKARTFGELFSCLGEGRRGATDDAPVGATDHAPVAMVGSMVPAIARISQR